MASPLMRAFTPRAASLRTSASASGRVLYAASWMVQIPRDVDSLVAVSFLAEAFAAGMLRGAAVAVARVTVVSARGGILLGIAVANGGLAVGALLGVLLGVLLVARPEDAETPLLGEPDERTVGAVALAAGAVAAGVLTVAVGHLAP